MKKLLLTFSMLLVAAFLLTGTTFAWFSMNKEVDAQGMKVKAKVDSALVIKKDSLPDSTTASITVDFGDANANSLLVSTYKENKLQTVSNKKDVDPATGLALSGKTLSFADATNDDTAGLTYYVDYTCYVAASGEALTGHNLTISISSETTAVTDINGAISVAVYAKKVGTTGDIVDAANYKGTINLAQKDVSIAYPYKTKSSIVIENTDIPMAGTDGTEKAWEFTLRVYVDGALQDNTNTTYVKNISALNIAEKSLVINFAATKFSA